MNRLKLLIPFLFIAILFVISSSNSYAVSTAVVCSTSSSLPQYGCAYQTTGSTGGTGSTFCGYSFCSDKQDISSDISYQSYAITAGDCTYHSWRSTNNVCGPQYADHYWSNSCDKTYASRVSTGPGASSDNRCAPPAPTTPTCTLNATKTGYVLGWTAVPGLQNYNVYAGTGTSTKLGSPTTNSFTTTNLTNKTFTITSYGGGRESTVNSHSTMKTLVINNCPAVTSPSPSVSPSVSPTPGPGGLSILGRACISASGPSGVFTSQTGGASGITFSWNRISNATSYILSYSYKNSLGVNATEHWPVPQPSSGTTVTYGIPANSHPECNTWASCSFTYNLKIDSWSVTPVYSTGNGQTTTATSFNTLICTAPTNLTSTVGTCAADGTVPVTFKWNNIWPATLGSNYSWYSQGITYKFFYSINGVAQTTRTVAATYNQTVSQVLNLKQGNKVDWHVQAVSQFGDVSPYYSATNSYTVPSTVCVVSPTPIPTVSVKAVVGIDGIGTAGDSKNRTQTNLNNQSPKHPTRSLTLEFFTTKPVANSTTSITATGNVTYDSTTGKFSGNITLPSTVTAGTAYWIRVKTDNHLKVLIPSAQTLSSTSVITLPTVNLIAGDITGDNQLSVQDFNILTSCYTYSTDQTTCNLNANYKTISDLDDNGVIDENDYNLFEREFAVVQNGD